MLNGCKHCISQYLMYLLQKGFSNDEMKYYLSVDKCYIDNYMWWDIHSNRFNFAHKLTVILAFIINQGVELFSQNCSPDLYIDLGLVFQIVLYHSVWSVIKIVFTCVLYMSRKLQPLLLWLNYLGMATELLSLLLSLQ